MYGGRLPIPAVKVEDMSTTNREDGKTTIVVLASEPSYSAFGNMVRKWLVCAICALAAVAMNAMWITANAYGDNSSDSSDSSSSSTDSGVTITENITDTENLLGSHAAEVTDAIAKTEKETGVHVHLLYLSSFNSQQKPGDWAATVMESMNPKPNTVMLAVASNDGNLVVVVSKNSDKWLLDNKTVDKLSEAAAVTGKPAELVWRGNGNDGSNREIQKSLHLIVHGDRRHNHHGCGIGGAGHHHRGHGGDSSAQGDQEGFQGRTPR